MLCTVATLVGVGASSAAPRVPTAVAVISKGANRVLVLVDARTLEPLRGARKIRLPRGAVFALSPNSSRAAIATDGDFYIVDTTSGRVVERFGNEGFDVSEGLYWVGSSDEPLIIAVGESKFGWEYTAVPSDYATIDTDLGPEVALHGELVLSGEGGLDFFSEGDAFVPLDGAPAEPFNVVGDVAHNNLYVVFRGGAVAEIGDPIAYHQVGLNGRDFSAIWAGHGQIALWGADGLGVIDTNTWEAHALAPNATGAVATRYGIVTWNSTTSTGVDVYAADGHRRLHVLGKWEVNSMTALGGYAYARNSDGPKQFSIDLKTGRVRVIRADAELAVPTLVSIP